ncbi:MAG: hypothetical protein P4M12_10330 [Gammaproteobacteria bacterium]|nr:hypothetical protein [Gammaproteobacteria bacterium]
MKNFILLGSLTVLLSSTLAFAFEVATPDNNATTQTSQKTMQLSDNNQPPGFNNSGHMPQGLTNQGKTPHGWNEGEKRGWDNNHGNNWHHHHHHKQTVFHGYGYHGNNGNGNNGNHGNGHND